MELNGTFFLVLTIGMSVINGGSGVIPLLAIISVLMAMIFAGGRPLQSRRDSGIWMSGRTEGKYVIPAPK
jgi:hypothetical protein